MGCLGVHFALLDEDVQRLRATRDEDERLEIVREEIEERYFAKHKAYLAESDKAWDAMHRALSDGEMTWDGGEYPLNHAILAGELLYTGDDYIMSLKTPTQVKDIAAALASIDVETFRVRYDAIDQASCGYELSAEDFKYTWHWFQVVRRLYARAAEENRHVLFTASQ